MFAVYGALPVLVVGIVVWGVVSTSRQRAHEPFTLATAAAWYTHVLMLAGVVMSMVGAGLAIKSLLGRIVLEYSYSTGTYFGPPGFDPLYAARRDRDNDLVLGLTLLGVGLVLALAHRWLASVVASRPGGAPTWVTRGTQVLFVAFAGVVTLIATAVAIYQVISYWLIEPGSEGRTAFGDAVGVAAVFLPVWALSVLALLRQMRRPEGQAPVPPPVTPLPAGGAPVPG